jgi:SAM-dependent methyltransferase
MSARCPLCSAAAARVCRLAAGAHDVLRCRRCRVAFLEPQPSAAELDAVYAAYYRHDNSALNPITAARYEQILSRLEDGGRPGRLLDVGCGAGQFLEVARRRGWRTFGTEISDSALRYLRDRDLEVYRGALPALGLEAQFEAVSMIEVLEHLPEPDAYLRAAVRALRPGGWLYLTTPNFDGLSRRLLQGRWRVLAPEHLFYFSPAALRRLAGDGFGRLRVRTKNLDLADLRLKLARPVAAAHGHHNLAETTAMRERIETSVLLRGAKAAVNAALRVARAGDTLELYAQRRAAW